jgi:hypothetical protein
MAQERRVSERSRGTGACVTALSLPPLSQPLPDASVSLSGGGGGSGGSGGAVTAAAARGARIRDFRATLRE